MGRARIRPERLAEKVLQVRRGLGLSQSEIWRRLGIEDLVSYTSISKYELGMSEPPLSILLQYARVAGVNMEVFADDELDLPEKLPGDTNHEAVIRKYSPVRSNRRR
jgi:transcriptional regulator with XRE-family HTH domain